MGRIAFIFAGQGDQFPGMGKDLYDKYEAARRVLDGFEALRPGTLKQCFEGSESELADTANTQPCLYAVETALAAVLSEKGVKAEAAAGFSLGEIAAASYSGVFDLETGFKVVTKRGKLMQLEAEKAETSMAAVVRLPSDKVVEICSAFDRVYPVNFNCPGQVSVSGLTENMPALFEAVKAAGGRAIPLKVRGAFHSPFMNDAAKKFRAELDGFEVSVPAIPLYSDLTAKVYGENVKDTLSSQICSPVKWEELILNMRSAGIDTFIEIGVGRTLTNMVKKTVPDANALTGSEYLEA